MNPQHLVELGEKIVSTASSRGAAIRMFGGVAVFARCPSVETHPKLKREYKDLDLVADRRAWGMLPELMSSISLEVERVAPDRLSFISDGGMVDVRGTDLRDCFTFDLAPRLPLDQTTLPPADLLLLKLQRFAFVEKDIQDAAALLLDHRVANDGEQDAIDRGYIYKLTNKDWGLWTTIFDNTVTMEKTLDQYLDPEEAQLVWRRIELIQEVMDGKGKSVRWWLRNIPNRHLRWHRECQG